MAIPGVSTRRGFLLGLITGFIHFAGTVYWTGATVSTFGGLPVIVAVFVAALLALYMAAYIAVTGAMVAILTRRFGLGGLCLAPAAWVAMEYLRGIVFGGFPWIPLGNTMVTLLPIAQLASAFGVHGLSLFVAFVNVGFAVAAWVRLAFGSTFAKATADGSADRSRLIAAGGTLGLIALLSVWGGMRLAGNELTGGTPIKIGLIQGNIAQTDKWNPRPRRHDSPSLLAALEAGRRQRRAVPHLAGVVHAVLFRRGSRRRHGPRPGARPRQAAAVGQRRDRRRRLRRGPTIRRSCSIPTAHGRGVSQDSARALRRIRAVSTPAVFRRPAGRSGVGVFTRHARDDDAGRGAHDQHGDLLRSHLSRGWRERRCGRAARC